MEERPKIKIPLTPFDQTVEFVGWLLIVALCIFTGLSYNSLPDTIPIHYNFSGEADGFGSKATIFILPLIATGLYIGMTIFNKFPHVFNYTTRITTENALSQYRNATRLIRYLKLIIVIIVGILAFRTIQHANDQKDEFGTWLIPIIIGLNIIPLFYLVVKSLKKK